MNFVLEPSIELYTVRKRVVSGVESTFGEDSYVELVCFDTHTELYVKTEDGIDLYVENSLPFGVMMFDVLSYLKERSVIV
tara:strand:- start:31 stop:270 length:240 start_codon:yes stop_codon:yes gene_type:complete